MKGYTPLGLIHEQPRAVRTSIYLAPTGMLALLISAMIASSVSLCADKCIREAEKYDDQLLQCIDHCEVQGDLVKSQSEAAGKDCQSPCHAKVGFTRRQIQHRQEVCEEQCYRHPLVMRLASIVGAMCLIVVTPLLGSYQDSCHCECCTGGGCSRRQAFYIIGWIFYVFSCVWVLPTVLEDLDEVGGKVFFGLAQGISMVAMGASRLIADRIGGGTIVGQPVTAASIVGSTITGQPVGTVGPTVEELQSEVQQLKQQIRDLVRLQTLQVQSGMVKSHDVEGAVDVSSATGR